MKSNREYAPYKTFFRGFCWLVLAVCHFNLNSEPLTDAGPLIQQITAVNGHSVGSVTAIVQDKSGFIWLASEQGLLRFDGTTIKRFAHSPDDADTLPHGQIMAMVIDEQGYLWLAMLGGGLSRFDVNRERFKNFVLIEGDSTTLDSNSLNSLSVGANNILWVGTEQGINRFDRQSFKNTRLNSGPLLADRVEGENIWQVYEDKQQRLWFVVKGQGLYLHDDKSNKTIHFQTDKNDSTSLDSNVVTRILETSEGVVWVGTLHGLNRFDLQKQQFVRYNISNGTAFSETPLDVTELFEDSRKNLWIGTSLGGLNVLRHNSDTISEINQGVSSADFFNALSVKTVFEDHGGVIWFGAKTGLGKLAAGGLDFAHWTDSSQSAAYILATFSDNNGILWAGSGQGVYRYNESVKRFEAEVESVGYVTAIGQDQQQNLLLNVDSRGVFVYNPQTKQLKPHAVQTQLHSNKLQSLAVDDTGKLWLGFYNASIDNAGLSSFDEKTGKYTRHLDKYTVESLLILNKSVLIATRYNGLQIMDRTTGLWTRIKDEDHSLIRIWSIYQDKAGQIWLATDNAGLAKLDVDNLTLTYTTVEDGLSSNTVFSIAEDHDGVLWLGTNKGISGYQPSTGAIKTFGRADGLGISTFEPKMAAVAANGDIAMANYFHLVRFSPRNLSVQGSKASQSFPILLSDFRLFNQPVNINSTVGEPPINQIINSVDGLTLTYKDYWFSVAFSSSNYNALENTRFAYQLEGFNEQWIEADDNNLIATFTSLPARDYTLKIRTGDKDGAWHQQYRSLHIKVTPPWWKTWQAYLFYVVAIVGAAYALYRYRTKALIQRANELEQGVIERTATINRLMSQKERMFANISHEFKTPLTLILNPLESISLRQSALDFGRKVSMMKRNGQRLLRMVDQLLELSKLETTQSDKRHNYSLADTLEMLLTSFQPLLDSKNLTLNHEPFEDVVLSLKADSLEMILTNLISNAIKYTKANGQITVAVNVLHNQVVVAVEDTGIGIDEENQKIVFNRFTRANEQHDENIPGAGIGLALVKELVEANEGTITLTSIINKGSTFTVVFPLGEQDNISVEKVTELSNSSLIEIDSLIKPQQTPEPEVVVVQQQSESNKPTLLLIDDNPDMLELLKDTLSEKYQCLSENNGENGVAAAKEQLPDLVISDVMMPGISGFEVLKQLKEGDLTGHIPVVLLTAKGDMQSRIRGWSEKADEYLEKPFNSVELLIRIESLLSIRSLLRHRYQREFTEPAKLLEQTSKEIIVKDGGIKLPVQTKQPIKAQAKENTINSINQAFFDKINGVLEKHYSDETLDVAFLASELAMSHRQLGRKMKSLLDLTPAESIRSFRLKKAAEQLNNGVSPGVVAHQVGFTSHSYFSQCFKAQFDCLPSNYN